MRFAIMLTTALTLTATVMTRHHEWRTSKRTILRPVLQTIEALAYTAAATIAAATVLTMLSRYLTQ